MSSHAIKKLRTSNNNSVSLLEPPEYKSGEIADLSNLEPMMDDESSNNIIDSISDSEVISSGESVAPNIWSSTDLEELESLLQQALSKNCDINTIVINFNSGSSIVKVSRRDKRSTKVQYAAESIKTFSILTLVYDCHFYYISSITANDTGKPVKEYLQELLTAISEPSDDIDAITDSDDVSTKSWKEVTKLTFKEWASKDYSLWNITQLRQKKAPKWWRAIVGRLESHLFNLLANPSKNDTFSKEFVSFYNSEILIRNKSVCLAFLHALQRTKAIDGPIYKNILYTIITPPAIKTPTAATVGEKYFKLLREKKVHPLSSKWFSVSGAINEEDKSFYDIDDNDSDGSDDEKEERNDSVAVSKLENEPTSAKTFAYTTEFNIGQSTNIVYLLLDNTGFGYAIKHVLLGEAATREHLALKYASGSYICKFFFAARQEQYQLYVLQLLQETVTEKIFGTTLRLPLLDVQSYCYQILLAIQELHLGNTKAIAHRDIKPDNLMFSRMQTKMERDGTETLIEPQIRIIDFSCSKEAKGISGRYSVGRSTLKVGTVGWKAPELEESTTDYTKEIDLYSAGLVMYFLLSHGGHPFHQKKLPKEGDPGFKNTMSSIQTKICAKKSTPVTGWDSLNAIKRQDVWENGSLLLDLLRRILVFNPEKRCSLGQALSHPFFWTDAIFQKILFLYKSCIIRSAKIKGRVKSILNSFLRREGANLVTKWQKFQPTKEEDGKWSNKSCFFYLDNPRYDQPYSLILSVRNLYEHFLESDGSVDIYFHFVENSQRYRWICTTTGQITQWIKGEFQELFFLLRLFIFERGSAPVQDNSPEIVHFLNDVMAACKENKLLKECLRISASSFKAYYVEKQANKS